jgi:XTP/dITP diphosphohydrolase
VKENANAQRNILAATGNPGKLREIKRVLEDLDLRVTGLKDRPDIPEPEETGKTFAENARAKALYYAEKTAQWCLADDSGLVVDAINGQPGVLSARFAVERCEPPLTRDRIDRANNDKLLEMLAGVEDEDRTARFICCLALAEPGGVLLETSGIIEGRIGHEPEGENGFGYDPLFLVPELNVTTAQLPPDEKNRISHRGKAVREFAEKLRRLLEGD